MHVRLVSIAKFFWPEIETLSEQRKIIAVGEIITFLYSIPLVVAGLSWLIIRTADSLIPVVQQEWLLIILVFGLIILFNRVNFFYIVEIRDNRYGSTSESLSTMVHWSAVLLIGPVVIWLVILISVTAFLWNWFRTTSKIARWNLARSLNLTIASTTLAKLAALHLYQILGGQIPIPNLSISIFLIAFSAMTLQFLLSFLFSSGYLTYHINVQKHLAGSNSIRPLLIFFLNSQSLPYLSHPFAIFAAGLYVQNSLGVYLLFLMGMLLVAYLARKLSWLAESSRQQSRQLKNLENLGREIINAPLDASTLPEILEEHVSTMFPSGSIAIWLSPDRLLLHQPSD
ncbi:MAG: hypothetical protein IBX69_07705 [Anaerolineales bacterium]|nr:hypothetical protein [Anaerolineales bacterium]